jgi:hypothetical protein
MSGYFGVNRRHGHVCCISKDKEHKKYEFGAKAKVNCSRAC